MKLSWPMSMKTRIARHGQAAIRASLSSTPREPLLFLYPTFARKSSTAQSPIEVSTLNRPSPTTSSSIHTVDANHTVSADTSTYSVSQAALDGTALPPRRVDGRISSQVHTSTPRSRHKGRVKDGPVEEVVKTPIERRMRRILSQAQRTKEEEQRKLALQREWQSQRNEELLRPGDPDWRVILQKLKQSTPQHGKWLAKAVTITGSAKSLKRLLLGLDDDIWSVANAYDCTVGLGERKEEKGEKGRSFVLSGSAVSISKTAAHLLRIAPGIQIDSYASGSQPENGTRFHMDSNVSEDGQYLPNHLRYVIPMNLQDGMQLGDDGLPHPPTQWNHSTFYNYVFHLARIDTYKPRHLIDHGTDLTSAVRDILHRLFTNPEYKPCIASKAIKEAVNFFLNISCLHEVRAIFNTHSIKDPQLYNLMLERTAKFNDLQNYQFILNLMIRKGCLPNRGTWLAFLNANKHNLQIRLTILSAMKEQGLLQNTPALKEACQVLSIADLEISLSKLESQAEYMNQMDLKFGPDWLSSNTANHILQVLGSNGFISRSCEFLEIMESRFIKVGSVAVNTILQHCNTSRNLTGALGVMKFVARFATFTPDEETYRILFHMAWESKNFNLTRVMWKYACLSGPLPYRIKDRVGRRIWRSKSKSTASDISSRTRFLSLITDFLVGKQISVPSDEGSVEAARFKKGFWATFLANETNLWQDRIAARPFEVMLQEAFELDTEWKARQAKSGKKFELEWMLVNGLHVPTQPYKSVVRNVVVSEPREEAIRKYAV